MNQLPDTDQADAEAQRATQGHTCSGCPTRMRPTSTGYWLVSEDGAK